MSGPTRLSPRRPQATIPQVTRTRPTTASATTRASSSGSYETHSATSGQGDGAQESASRRSRMRLHVRERGERGAGELALRDETAGPASLRGGGDTRRRLGSRSGRPPEPAPSASRASQTAKPSMSGSATSRRTSSGASARPARARTRRRPPPRLPRTPQPLAARAQTTESRHGRRRSGRSPPRADRGTARLAPHQGQPCGVQIERGLRVANAASEAQLHSSGRERRSARYVRR